MRVVIDVPEALASRLGGSPDAVSDAVRVALLLDAYRTGQMTAAELQEVLDLPTVDAFDAFLKAHDVSLEYSDGDITREGALIARLWPRSTAAPRP